MPYGVALFCSLYTLTQSPQKQKTFDAHSITTWRPKQKENLERWRNWRWKPTHHPSNASVMGHKIPTHPKGKWPPTSRLSYHRTLATIMNPSHTLTTARPNPSAPVIPDPKRSQAETKSYPWSPFGSAVSLLSGRDRVCTDTQTDMNNIKPLPHHVLTARLKRAEGTWRTIGEPYSPGQWGIRASGGWAGQWGLS